MLKVGFIGNGGMGITHLTNLRVLKEKYPIEVIAVADRLSEKRRMASELFPEAKLYESGLDLIEKGEYDLVWICAPSYEHTRLSLLAMEKGVDVFCEKPVCITEEECRALEEQMKKYPVKFMVGQVVRSMPEFLYLKKMIDEKPYGKLRDIVMQRISGNVNWGYQDWFHADERSGSVILDLHIHDLDYLRYVLGEPTKAEPQHVACFDSGMINHIITHLEFGGIKAVCEGVWHVSPLVPFHASFRADFDQATVVYDGGMPEPRLVIYPECGDRIVPDIPQDQRKINNGMNISSLGGYYIEDKYYIESILNHTQNDVAPLEEGIRSVRLALQIKEKALNKVHQG